jgi:hypothetical protein
MLKSCYFSNSLFLESEVSCFSAQVQLTWMRQFACQEPTADTNESCFAVASTGGSAYAERWKMFQCLVLNGRL